MFLVFFGPPGCGKGTQAQYLQEEDGFSVISSGNLIRAEIEAQTDFGKQIEESYRTGKLLPGDAVLDLVQKVIATEGAKSILFDGFPRTVSQATAFDEYLRSIHRKIDTVISFSIADDIIIDRILGRITCADCKHVFHVRSNPPTVEGVCDSCGGTRLERRSDDTEESIRQRLNEYHNKTEPLKEFYKSKGIMVEIDANQPISAVRQQVQQEIDAISEKSNKEKNIGTYSRC